MKTIYKYELKTEQKQILQLPEEAVILCVQMQENKICAWTTLAPEQATKDRIIYIFGTGEQFDESLYLSYISTFQHNGFVFHVFEEILD